MGLQTAVRSPCLHVVSLSAVRAPSSSWKDTVTLNKAHPSDFTLTSSPLQGPYLQIQSHTAVLQVR